MTVDLEAAFSTNSNASTEALVGPFLSAALPPDENNDFEFAPL